MSVAEKLLTIAENSRDMYSLAESKKGMIRGNIIKADNVSSYEHSLGVKISNQNLIPYPYTQSSKTHNEITFTVNSDGSLTANGTATGQAYIFINQGLVLEAGTYTLSGCPSGGGWSSYCLNVATTGGGYYDFGSGKTFTLTEKTVVNSINVNVFGGAKVENLTFYPQLKLETGITDFSGIEVSRYGKNLVDLSKTPDVKGANYNFDTITGYYEVINAKAYAPNRWRFKVPTNTTIYLCASEVTNCNVQVSSVLQDGTSNINILLQKGSFVYVNTGNYSELTLSRYTSSAYDLISTKGVIVALYNTNYEPYKAPQTATANADGTVNGLTSLSPNITLIPNNEGVSVECTYYTNERDPILEATENIKTALVELKENL